MDAWYAFFEELKGDKYNAVSVTTRLEYAMEWLEQ